MLQALRAIDDEDINAHIVTQTLRNLIRSLYVQISAKLLIMSLHSLGVILFLSLSLSLRCECTGHFGIIDSVCILLNGWCLDGE